MESKDMVSSYLDKDEQELQRLCEIKKEMKKKFDNIFHKFHICIHGLRPDWFHQSGEYAFQFLFGEKFQSFKNIFDNNIDQLNKQLEKRNFMSVIPRHVWQIDERACHEEEMRIKERNVKARRNDGKSSSPGNDTDAEGASISKNGSDDDITIAESSHEKHKTEVFEMTKENNTTYFNEYIEADRKAKRFEKESQSQFIRDRDTIRDLEQQRDKLELSVVELKRQSLERQKTQTIFKKQLSDKEDKYLNDILQLQAKNKDLENIVCPCVLSQAYAKIPKLYNAYELRDENVQLHAFDSEETLEDAEKSQLKMKEFQKDEKVQELKIKPIDYTNLNNLYETFVPQVELSLEQKYFLETFISSEDPSNESSPYSSFETKPTNKSMPTILQELQFKLEVFQKRLLRDIKEMKDVFVSMESDLDETLKQNERLKDRLLEVTLAEDVKNLVITSSVEIRNKNLHDETEWISTESKDVSNERNTSDTFCNDAFDVTQ
ncbi:reverse transcriptase zinc-binding domain-containing protein [Tanacetum coccineum]|uniref:Reverse transcriptase zinc-binding domain-containing protein n=1 Tax=Tanacetum coccineum TaxID=301880 RepID=A0ABQ5E1R4_9ASTR